MSGLLRELGVLGLLVGLMAVVRRFAVIGPEVGGLLPGQVAMALGFALLAAHLFGRVGAQLRLPLITGYLLAGVLLGPHVLGMMSLEVKEGLEVVTELALGLIALTAGGELALEQVRPRMKAIGWVTGLQTVVIFGGTSLLLLGAHLMVRRSGGDLVLTSGLDWGQLIALALILGLVSTANSPSSTVAVINELKSRGPLSTVALGVTVVKDVVVILLMGLTLTVVRTLVAERSTFSAALVGEMALEIVFSLVAGALLGLAIIAYLRWIGREVAIAVLVAVFVAAEGSQALEGLIGIHPHFLVVCMTAGFLVENLSEEGRTLMGGIERTSLPVYVVFFTLAGVALDLESLRRMWPLALLFVAWRALLLYGTSWLGCHVAGEEPRIKHLSWAGFLPQAGVSLGLAELVAQRYPEMGRTASTLILAIIAVNQLIGPVLFKWSLVRAGEAGGEAEAHRAGTAASPASGG